MWASLNLCCIYSHPSNLITGPCFDSYIILSEWHISYIIKILFIFIINCDSNISFKNSTSWFVSFHNINIKFSLFLNDLKRLSFPITLIIRVFLVQHKRCSYSVIIHNITIYWFANEFEIQIKMSEIIQTGKKMGICRFWNLIVVAEWIYACFKEKWIYYMLNFVLIWSYKYLPIWISR